MSVAMRRVGVLKSTMILAVLGFVTATYALYYHYSTGEGWCDISAAFSCDVVNRGPYSEVYGIPVALLGMIGYATLFGAAWLLLKEDTREYRRLFFLLSLGGFVFTIYLLYIEVFVLYTFCIACLFSALIMMLLFLSSILLLRKTFI